MGDNRRFRQAIEHHTEALRLARDTSSRYVEAEALAGLASAVLHAGEPTEAGQHAQRVLDLARQAGYRLLEGQALTVLAEAALTASQTGLAAAGAHQAVAVHRETGQRLNEAHNPHPQPHATRPTDARRRPQAAEQVAAGGGTFASGDWEQEARP